MTRGARLTPVTPARLRHSRLGRAVARYRFGIVAALLAVVVLVNLGQFRGIERQRFPEMRAADRYNSSDLGSIAYSTCAWCRQRYGLYLALGTVAPGARIVIPTPSRYQASPAEANEVVTRLRVFGRASSVTWVPSPAAAGPGFDPQPDEILATGFGGAPDIAIDAVGPHSAAWVLAVDPATMPANHGNPATYLYSTATAEGPSSTGSVREFALIRWAHPREQFPYQDLLVETKLLPPALRESLHA
ncbi:MAG: hypothetical protein J2P15_17270 [Micromonosporaceae bacterium]|nr:hypothetical protein [Micromonosporaceae bacterium]